MKPYIYAAQKFFTCQDFNFYYGFMPHYQLVPRKQNAIKGLVIMK